MTTETILPELVGTPASLPEHTQATIRAYGAACARTALQSAQVQQWKKDAEQAKRLAKDLSNIVHDMTVVMQAAWIEWQHGEGAEKSMMWIQNTLVGPGYIPDEDAPYGKDAQAWMDANRADPFPTCFCGRPSNILWMGQGFCCREHYADAKSRHDAAMEAKE